MTYTHIQRVILVLMAMALGVIVFLLAFLWFT